MLKEQSSQIADTLFFASAGAAGTSILADVDHVVSIIAGIVATIAGCASIYMHVTRRMERRKKEQSDN
jgi:hypothetical protein